MPSAARTSSTSSGPVAGAVAVRGGAETLATRAGRVELVAPHVLERRAEPGPGAPLALPGCRRPHRPVLAAPPPSPGAAPRTDAQAPREAFAARDAAWRGAN